MDEITQLISAMQRLLPDSVELVGGKVGEQPPVIDKQEWQLVDHASKKRQREFACGRHYAHQALENLGAGQQTIGRDERGAPLWPKGIAGSISHTNEYCAVLLSSQSEFQSVGIDLEESGRMKPNLWSRLLTGNEITYLKSIADIAEQTRHAATMFSAKEAFYKCDYPLHRQQIDFTQVELQIKENHELGITFHKLDHVNQYISYHVTGVTHVLTVVISL